MSDTYRDALKADATEDRQAAARRVAEDALGGQEIVFEGAPCLAVEPEAVDRLVDALLTFPGDAGKTAAVAGGSAAIVVGILMLVALALLAP